MDKDHFCFINAASLRIWAEQHKRSYTPMQSDYDSGRDAGYNEAIEDVNKFVGIQCGLNDEDYIPKWLHRVKPGDVLRDFLMGRYYIVNHLSMSSFDKIGIHYFFEIDLKSRILYENAWLRNYKTAKPEDIVLVDGLLRSELYGLFYNDYGITWDPVKECPVRDHSKDIENIKIIY